MISSASSAVNFPLAAALEAARLCNASYAADVVSACAALPIPYDITRFGVGGPASGPGPACGFLARGGGADQLIFEGTHTEMGWLEDANLILVPQSLGCPGMVHAGFYSMFCDIAEEVVSILTGHKGPLWISGHSLGGPLARFMRQLIRYRLPDVEVEVMDCITFGEPRGGDPFWAKHQDSFFLGDNYRFVRAGDPVPGLPLPPIYEHIGHIALLHGGRLIVDADAFQIALDEIGAVIQDDGDPVQECEEHGMVRYLADMEAVAGSTPSSLTAGRSA
jgi:hypothetical protein